MKTFFALIIITLIGCARASSIGANKDCVNIPSACQSNEQKTDSLFGSWVSSEPIVQEPMTYYQQYFFQKDAVDLYQFCIRSDGQKVVTGIEVPVKYIKSKIVIMSGRDSTNYGHGISCRANLNRGEWHFEISGDGSHMEIQNNDRGVLIRLKRLVN